MSETATAPAKETSSVESSKSSTTPMNPNVEVTNIDESTLNNQNSYSFSDIDQALKQRSEKSKKPKEKIETEEKPGKVDKSEKSEKTEKSEKKKDVKDSPKETDEKIDKEIKKLKAKYGESIFELHPDTLIPHKVDGKVEEIPVKELLNSYSGKVAYDKRFQELDVDKKSYAKEKQEWITKTKEVDEFVTTFFNKAQSGQAIEALQMLAAGTGQDPIDFTKSLKSAILREHENYVNMSDEDRRKHDYEQESQYYDRKINEKKEAVASYQEREAEIKNINNFCSKYGVPLDQFEQTYRGLVHQLNEQGVNPQTLKVSDVEKYYVDNIAYSMASTSLGNLRPEWMNKAEIVEIVSNYVRTNVGISQEAVDAYVMQTFDIKPSKSVAQVLKHESNTDNGALGLQKKLNVPKRPMFFSDI